MKKTRIVLSFLMSVVLLFIACHFGCEIQQKKCQIILALFGSFFVFYFFPLNSLLFGFNWFA